MLPASCDTWNLVAEPTGFIAFSASNHSYLFCCNSGWSITLKNFSIKSITALSAVDDFSSRSLAEKDLFFKNYPESKVLQNLSILMCEVRITAI